MQWRQKLCTITSPLFACGPFPRPRRGARCLRGLPLPPEFGGAQRAPSGCWTSSSIRWNAGDCWSAKEPLLMPALFRPRVGPESSRLVRTTKPRRSVSVSSIRFHFLQGISPLSLLAGGGFYWNALCIACPPTAPAGRFARASGGLLRQSLDGHGIIGHSHPKGTILLHR